MSVLDILDIHALLLLSWFHLPDWVEVSLICRRFQLACDTHRATCTFYGLPLPKANTLVRVLLQRRHTELNDALTRALSHRRIRYMETPLWNGMTLWEIGWLMHDPVSLAILERHHRNVLPHRISIGFIALAKLVMYDELRWFPALWGQITPAQQRRLTNHMYYFLKGNDVWLRRFASACEGR